MVNVFELDGHNFWMHHFQGCLVGGPPLFEDIEISSYALVTISYSYFSLHASILMFLACHAFHVHYVKCNVH